MVKSYFGTVLKSKEIEKSNNVMILMWSDLPKFGPRLISEMDGVSLVKTRSSVFCKRIGKFTSRQRPMGWERLYKLLVLGRLKSPYI